MERAKIQKNICKKDYTTRRKVFSQLSVKGMIRFDLNMEHDEVYGKFVLTVIVFVQFCIFVFLQKIC